MRNWIDRGELPAVRVGTRRVRVRQSDLDAFLAAGATSTRDSDGDDDSAAGRRGPASDARDQFLGALTEILRTAAASKDSHDEASVLRELAAAAEALADTLERE